MKTGLSLVELATEIERQAAAKRDYLVDTRGVKMLTHEEDGAVLMLQQTGSDEEAPLLSVNSLSHEKLGEWAGIKRPY
jgi:hypothetical protein